jgi:hypothetical protein
LYGCYLMCLSEISCKRKLSGDFENHAKGLLISYQQLEKPGSLVFTHEEQHVFGKAYEIISDMTLVSRSEWHKEENWRGLTDTITQRLESAATRSLSVRGSSDATSRKGLWIPDAHSLAGSEWVVDGLCDLFNNLSTISAVQDYSHHWEDTVGQIALHLETLRNLLFHSRYCPGQDYSSTFHLDDGISTLSGDKFTRQLLALYYVFLSQYRIMALEWTNSVWEAAVQTSLAVFRLFPPPHEAQYPAQIRFSLNRGLWIAAIIATDSENCKGKPIFFRRS